jgi:hypothetical protein
MAGTTPVSSMIRSRCAGWKLETPIALTSPSCCSSIKCLPGLNIEVVGGHRPVDQVQVDVFELQPLEALLASGLGLVFAVIVVEALGRDEHIARDPGPRRAAPVQPPPRFGRRPPCRDGDIRPRGRLRRSPRCLEAGSERHRSRAAGSRRSVAVGRWGSGLSGWSSLQECPTGAQAKRHLGDLLTHGRHRTLSIRSTRASASASRAAAWPGTPWTPPPGKVAALPM